MIDAMRMAPAKAPIEKLMFVQAQRFRGAAIKLATGPWEVAKNYAVPSMFNSYVASELYFKLLNYMHSGQQMNGHNLGVLFMNLPSHHRAKIRKRWKAQPRMQVETIPPVAVPKTLEDQLAAAAYGYEEFRYLWEADGKGIFLIHDLPDILHEVTIALYPDLAKP